MPKTRIEGIGDFEIDATPGTAAFEEAIDDIKAQFGQKSGKPRLFTAGPMRPLQRPGVGLAKAGLGTLGTTLSMGAMSPDPQSIEQVAAEGTAAVAAQLGGGLGVNLAERMVTPLVERFVASGWGGKMALFLVKPLARVGGGYGGGVGASLATSGTLAAFEKATGKDVGAPKTLEETRARAAEAGKFQAGLQAGAELLIPPITSLIGRGTAAAERGAVASEMNVKAKKLEKLQTEKAEYLKAQNIREIKEAQAESINKIADDVVRDMGQKTVPEQMVDLRTNIRTRVMNRLETQMKAGFTELDNAVALAEKTQPRTENLVDIGKLIEDIAAKEPRGPGVVRPFTKPQPRFAEIVRDAKAGQKTTSAIGYADTTGKTVLKKAVGEPPPQDDLTELFRVVLEPAKNEKIRLAAMLKGRGTISREIANPTTDEETKNLLTQILKPWDQHIESGLTKINPELAVKFGAAKDVWHKNSLIIDKVIAKRFASGGARSLTQEIQPNAPRNVEQVRLALKEALPAGEAEQAMDQLIRAKTEELMIGSKGEPDLAGYRRRYEDYGNTMRNLHNTPERRATQDRLLMLSDEFAHMKNNPSIKNDQHLAALDKAIEAIETGGERKKLLSTVTGFFLKPHVAMYGAAGMATAAGIAGAHAYGPIGLGGGLASIMVGKAAERRLIPALVMVAENKPEASKLLIAMKQWREQGANPRTASNLARAMISAYDIYKAEEKIKEAPNAAPGR